MSVKTEADSHRREAEQFRLLAENVKDYAIFILDDEGRVQTWSVGGERLLGYDEEEVIGESFARFFTESDIAKGEPQRELRDAARIGRGMDDRWHMRKDGSLFWCSGVLTPLRDEEGKSRGFAKIMRDLTEQKLFEAYRHETEARKSAILETALDSIVMVDAQGKVLEFNPAAERTFGYRRADVIGRELADLIVPPALRERHRKGLAHYVATGEAAVLGKRIELPALRADGTEFPVELAITRIPVDGPPQFAAYLRDIGDRVRTEQLRSVRLAVTQHLAQVSGIEQAASSVLQAVCENLKWDIGFFWTIGSGTDALKCIAHWLRPGTDLKKFVEVSCAREFGRGEGLPGEVWSSGRTRWIPDVRQAANFPRTEVAAAGGLQSAFAVPVVVFGEKTVGVMEFFTEHMRQPDEELLETMATVAGHVGEFIERRQAEETLKESEARFRGLMEQAPFSVQIFATDGRTVRVNRAWSELWGVTLEQIAEYNILEDPQLEANGILPYIRRAFAGDAVVIPEVRYDPNVTIPGVTARDDPVRWVSAVAYPLKDDTGRVREIVLTHEDITARKKAESALRGSEEKWRLLADTIPQLAWMAYPDGHIFWYNRRWYEYTGTTAESMEGWGWQSVHDPDVLPDVLSRWKASIARGEPLDMVFPLRGADGQFRPFLTRVNPLRDPEGKIVYWFGTNTDISDIKHMEEALRDADRRKDEFLATLAHELRNPLAPIRNSLQILKMPRLDAATAHQTRDMMERQVHHLVRLVDDLMDVSRVVRGKIELRKERVELSTVVARAAEIAQPLIEALGHRLEIDLPAESLPIDGDPVRLEQVIGNLLTNAAKYTEASGHISVSARRERGEVVLGVRDDGIGISPDVLPHVFELFVQGDSSAARSQGGLGVGLTLVKNLVELHGGTVHAHSAGLGKGSEFTLRLPVLPASNEETPALGAAAFALTPSSGKRLLVVDDNRDAADSLAVLLRMQGHEVRVALDGTSALEHARAFAPQLVFLDIGMPGMDGYEVARRMRGLPELDEAVLVALTGWGQKEDRRRSAEAGFDQHLVKPAGAKEVEALLANLEKAKSGISAS